MLPTTRYVDLEGSRNTFTLTNSITSIRLGTNNRQYQGTLVKAEFIFDL